MAMQNCKTCGGQFETHYEGQTLCPVCENKGQEERKPSKKE